MSIKSSSDLVGFVLLPSVQLAELPAHPMRQGGTRFDFVADRRFSPRDQFCVLSTPGMICAVRAPIFADGER